MSITTDRTPWERQRLAFTCGYCLQPPGAWCLDRHGEPAQALHADRTNQATGEPRQSTLASRTASPANRQADPMRQVRDWAGRARRAQEAINELGAGPPGAASCRKR